MPGDLRQFDPSESVRQHNWRLCRSAWRPSSMDSVFSRNLSTDACPGWRTDTLLLQEQGAGPGSCRPPDGRRLPGLRVCHWRQALLHLERDLQGLPRPPASFISFMALRQLWTPGAFSDQAYRRPWLHLLRFPSSRLGRSGSCSTEHMQQQEGKQGNLLRRPLPLTWVFLLRCSQIL